MFHLKNKIISRLLVFAVIVTMLFWLMPSSMVFGDDTADNPSIESLQAAVNAAKSAAEPYVKAVDDAQAAFDSATAALDAANTDLNAAKSAVEQYVKAVEDAQADLDEAQAAIDAADSLPAVETIYSASLNVVAKPATVKPGESITFKIVVKNTGNMVLNDVAVLDKLPELVIFEPIEGMQFDEELKEVSYTIDNLDPGEISVKSITVGVPIVVNEAVTLSNIVSLASEKIDTIEKKADITFEASVVEETTEEESIEDEEGEFIGYKFQFLLE